MAEADEQLEKGLHPKNTKMRCRPRRERLPMFCDEMPASPPQTTPQSSFSSKPSAALPSETMPQPFNAWKMPRAALLPKTMLQPSLPPKPMAVSPSQPSFPFNAWKMPSAMSPPMQAAVSPCETTPKTPASRSEVLGSVEMKDGRAASADQPEQPNRKDGRAAFVGRSEQPKQSRHTTQTQASTPQELWEAIQVLEHLAGKQEELGRPDVATWLRTGHYNFKY